MKFLVVKLINGYKEMQNKHKGTQNAQKMTQSDHNAESRVVVPCLFQSGALHIVINI